MSRLVLLALLAVSASASAQIADAGDAVAADAQSLGTLTGSLGIAGVLGNGPEAAPGNDVDCFAFAFGGGALAVEAGLGAGADPVTDVALDLFSGDGRVLDDYLVGFDDDEGAENLERFVAGLDPGDYLVCLHDYGRSAVQTGDRLTGWSGSGSSTGPYSLVLTAVAGTDEAPDAGDLVGTAAFDLGTLDGAVALLGEIGNGPEATPADDVDCYAFTFGGGGLSFESGYGLQAAPVVDVTVSLFDASGAVLDDDLVDFDDDEGLDYHERGTVGLEPGDYTVCINEYGTTPQTAGGQLTGWDRDGSEAGRYVLLLEAVAGLDETPDAGDLIETAAFALGTLDAPVAVNGEIGNGPEATPDHDVDCYAFTSAGGALTVESGYRPDADLTDVTVSLFDASGAVVVDDLLELDDDDGVENHERFSVGLEPGDYAVCISEYGTTPQTAAGQLTGWSRSGSDAGPYSLTFLPGRLVEEGAPPTRRGDAPDAGWALDVWPNPAAGPASVQLSGAPAGDARIAVYDVLGREVAVLHDGPAGSDLVTRLDTGTLLPGTYLVRATAGGVAVTRALSVAR